MTQTSIRIPDKLRDRVVASAARNKRSMNSEIEWLLEAGLPKWWIATDQLTRGGAKLIGPFGSRELALDVRTYVERVNAPYTYWVDCEELDPEVDPEAVPPANDSGGATPQDQED